MSLTPMEAKFAAEWVGNGGQGSKAYLAAGYSPNHKDISKKASEIKSRPAVKAEISRILDELMEHTILDARVQIAEWEWERAMVRDAIARRNAEYELLRSSDETIPDYVNGFYLREEARDKRGNPIIRWVFDKDSHTALREIRLEAQKASGDVDYRIDVNVKHEINVDDVANAKTKLLEQLEAIELPNVIDAEYSEVTNE